MVEELIQQINDVELWDKFVEESPYSLLFHRWNFLKTIEEYSGFTFLPYGIYRGEELICVFPLFFRKYYGVKMLFSPPPQTAVPYLGPVISPVYNNLRQRKKESFMNTIVDEIDREIKRIAPNYINFITSPLIFDIRPFKWNNYNVETLYTYAINLDKPLDEIKQGFSKDCRERIRYFGKNKPMLKESNDMDTFYQLSLKLYGKQGLRFPLINMEYLNKVMGMYPDNLKMYFLMNNGEIADIEGAYAYHNQFKLLWGVSNINEKLYGNQEYATWELIRMAREKGCKEFEIVGANTKRISHYQSKFNPELRMYFSITRCDTMGYLAYWSYMNIIKRKIF